MGEHIMLGDGILLFDSYSPDCKRLHDSFRMAGCEWPAVVLEENDFLPEGVMSVYDMFLGYFGVREKSSGIGKPRFFNEIECTAHWSINAGIGVADYGTITYQHEEKGRIYYIDSEKPFLVKAVDWFDRKGNVRFRDHYNRYGAICARTVYDGQGKELGKTWFSAEGQEAITLNCVTGDLIVNDDGCIRLFRTKMDMMLYFFRRAGFERSRIFYNSLTNPFLVSNNLTATEKWDILFWQDDIGDTIPENMQMILNGQAARTGKILVQRRDTYNRLLELGADPGMVQKMGYVYDFKKENYHRPHALICTNTDNIEYCEEFIRRFPGMHFHIAAVTLMSPKLMDLEKYDNVSLYPGVPAGKLDELFQLCDYYFDINHWTEIVSAVYRAFLHNQLIFAFEETVHNRTYVADEHVYPIAEFDRMVSDVREIMADKEIMEKYLELQRRNAMAEDEEILKAVYQPL